MRGRLLSHAEIAAVFGRPSLLDPDFETEAKGDLVVTDGGVLISRQVADRIDPPLWALGLASWLRRFTSARWFTVENATLASPRQLTGLMETVGEALGDDRPRA